MSQDEAPSPAPAREMSASEQAARAVRESMQVSGQRDRLKSWLFSQLSASGWTAALSQQAVSVSEAHPAETGPLRADDLAGQIAEFGHGRLRCEMAACWTCC